MLLSRAYQREVSLRPLEVTLLVKELSLLKLTVSLRFSEVSLWGLEVTRRLIEVTVLVFKAKSLSQFRYHSYILRVEDSDSGTEKHCYSSRQKEEVGKIRLPREYRRANTKPAPLPSDIPFLPVPF